MSMMSAFIGFNGVNAKKLPPATFVASATSMTTTIAKPSGLREGDLMFVFMPYGTFTSITGGDGGWATTSVGPWPTYGYYTSLAWKVVTAFDVSSSLTAAGGNSNGLISAAFRGPKSAVAMSSAVSTQNSNSLTLSRNAKSQYSLGQVAFSADRDAVSTYPTRPSGWTTGLNFLAQYFNCTFDYRIDDTQPTSAGEDAWIGYPTTYNQAGFNIELRGEAADLEAFDPSKLSTIKAWWSPDYGVTMDGSNRVAAWADKIGGHTPVQATAANKPLWVASASSMLGGARPLMYFDSTARFLEMANFPASFPTGNDETWCFAASRLTSTGSDWTPAILGYAGHRGIGYAGANWNSQSPYPTNNFAVMHSSGSDMGQFSPSMITNAIVGARWGGTGTRARRNGSRVGESGLSSAITTGNLRIGRRTNGSDNIVGYVGDIIVTGSLTVWECLKLEGWLAWRYGQAGSLPSTHPYKNAPP